MAGADFFAISGSLTIPAGQTSGVVTVQVLGDRLNETNENFAMRFNSPANATLAQTEVTGWIINDDLLPTITNSFFQIVADSCAPTNGVADPGERITVALALRNISSGGASASNLTATLLPLGSPVSFGAVPPGSVSSTQTFTFTAPGTCGALLPVVFTIAEGGTVIGNLTNFLRLGAPRLSFAEEFDQSTNLPAGWTTSLSGAGAVWLPVTNAAATPPNAVFSLAPATTSDNQLISAPFTVATSNAILTFRHAYSTESCCDHASLDLSITNGPFSPLASAGGIWISNGPPASGWSGVSSGFPGSLIAVAASLPPSAASQSVRLRWRMTTDSSVGGGGWYVDSVAISDGWSCCESPVVRVSSLGIINGQAVLRWFAVTGATYQVEYQNDLGSGAWFNGGQVQATNSTGEISVTAGGRSQRFFRVIQR